MTIVTGAHHRAMWNHFSQSWKPYAERHGYDIVVIDRPIDPEWRRRGKSPHWQKCLILEHPDVAPYDDVVWMDCDIYVNHASAPCVVETHGSDSIGAVVYSRVNRADEQARRIREGRVHDILVLREMDHYGLGRHPEPREIYARAGLGDDVDDCINTGVLVLKPRLHAAILRHVYDHYEETPLSLYDNHPLSYHLLKNRLMEALDPRFNVDYLYEMAAHYPFLFLQKFDDGSHANVILRTLCALAIISNGYFIHAVSGAPSARRDLMRIPAEIVATPELEMFGRVNPA